MKRTGCNMLNLIKIEWTGLFALTSDGVRLAGFKLYFSWRVRMTVVSSLTQCYCLVEYSKGRMSPIRFVTISSSQLMAS